MDPVRRILGFEEEDNDSIIVIESDQEEEELDDDVFVNEEMSIIQTEDGEPDETAADTEEEQKEPLQQQQQQEEEVKWEDIPDQALTSLVEQLEVVNMKPEQEEEEEEEITDQEMHLIGQQSDGMNHSSSIPVGASIMVVRALFSLIHEVVTANCEGCINDYGGQMDHPQCLFMPWEEKVDLYFTQALHRLTEEVLLSFFPCVYPVTELFDSECEAAKKEATRFLAVDMKTSLVQNHIKEMLLNTA